MRIQTMPIYLVKITKKANSISSKLLCYPLLLYEHHLYDVPYKLSKLVIFTSQAYQRSDFIEAMAAAAILDYRTQYFQLWLNRKRGFYGRIHSVSN